MLIISVLYHPSSSNAMYLGPDCNEQTLPGYPLVLPYFTKKIVFLSNMGSIDQYNFTLYAVNSDGTGSLKEISNIPYNSAVAVSSDGTKVTFVREVDGINQIFVANTDGTKFDQLTFDSESKSVIGITPDGKKIIYGTHYDRLGSTKNYYSISSDTKNTIQITNDSSRKDWSVLSADGSTLVFNDESRQPKIFAVRSDGTDFHYVTNGSLFSHAPVISENGSKIVFSRDNPGDSNEKYLFTINTDGTKLVKLLQNPIYSGSDFTISLDGSKVAFDDSTLQEHYVSVINSDGAGYRKIDTLSYYSSMPLLSHDGSKLVYSKEGNTPSIMIASTQGYQSVLQVDSNTVSYTKEISLDGTRLVYDKISGSTAQILGSDTNGKSTLLFDNSLFKSNPDCKITEGGPIEPSPNVIRDSNGSWVTPLQTHDKNGNNLTIHYEGQGVNVTGKYQVPPEPQPPTNIFEQFLNWIKQIFHFVVVGISNENILNLRK